MSDAISDHTERADRWEGLKTVMRLEALRYRRSGRKMTVWCSIGASLFSAILLYLPQVFSILTHTTYTLDRINSYTIFILIYVTVGLVTIFNYFLILSQTAGRFAYDRQQGIVQDMLLTRLRDDEIIGGRLLAAFIMACKLALVPLVLVIFRMLTTYSKPGYIIYTIVTSMLDWGIIGAIGLYCATRIKQYGYAIAVAYALAGIWICQIPYLNILTKLCIFWLLAHTVYDLFAGGLSRLNPPVIPPPSRITIPVVFCLLLCFVAFKFDAFSEVSLCSAANYYFLFHAVVPLQSSEYVDLLPAMILLAITLSLNLLCLRQLFVMTVRNLAEMRCRE